MGRRFAAAGALAALFVSVVAEPAFAQAARTWVSGVGDDANPCSRTAPCKTFAGAISKTAAKGVIDVLDPGGFGPVTITKAITIEARGTMASVLNSGTNGIVVNAGAQDPVILRGIAIQGAGTGLTGIKFLAGRSLLVEDCAVTNQNGPAIDFEPAAAATLALRRTTITSNAGGLLVGGSATVAISNSHFVDSVFGLHVKGTARASIFDSIFANNTGQGIWAEDTAEVSVDHGLVSDNGVGVQGDATVRLSDVMLAHNTTAIAGAKVVSFGNNRISAGNGADGAPSGTLPQQ